MEVFKQMITEVYGKEILKDACKEEKELIFTFLRSEFF